MSNWLKLSAIICFLFGLMFLFLVNSYSDGTWFFYAKAFLSGKKIYSDLHVIIQPLFIVINAIGLTLFGDSYIGQKLIFVMILGLYVFFSAQLVDKTRLSPIQKSIFLLCFFFIGIHFVAYRFDDYHVISNLLLLIITNLLIQFSECYNEKKCSIISFYLGCAIGTIILLRINDGLAIFLLTLIFYLIRAIQDKKTSSYLFLFLGLIGLFILVSLSIREFALTSIFQISSTKGSFLQILISPLLLVSNSLHFLLTKMQSPTVLIYLSIIFLLSGILWFSCKLKISLFRFLFQLGVICFFLIFFRSILLFNYFIDPIDFFTPVAILLSFCYITFEIFRWLLTKRETQNSWLLLIPVVLFFSGAMSSAGVHFGLYFPFALMILIAFIIMQRPLSNSFHDILIALIIVNMGLSGAFYRINIPFSWHNYFAPAIYAKRIWIKTKNYGYMPFDLNTYAFIFPFCNRMSISAKTTLLSLPFPYANYICGIKPWHYYIQTFFDTTPRSVVMQLITELNQSPPNYILYQRQLINLGGHENTYNHGNSLAQRNLDWLIFDKLNNGEWKILLHRKFGYTAPYYGFGVGDNWYLIQTGAKPYCLWLPKKNTFYNQSPGSFPPTQSITVNKTSYSMCSP